VPVRRASCPFYAWFFFRISLQGCCLRNLSVRSPSPCVIATTSVTCSAMPASAINRQCRRQFARIAAVRTPSSSLAARFARDIRQGFFGDDVSEASSDQKKKSRLGSLRPSCGNAIGRGRLCYEAGLGHRSAMISGRAMIGQRFITFDARSALLPPQASSDAICSVGSLARLATRHRRWAVRQCRPRQQIGNSYAVQIVQSASYPSMMRLHRSTSTGSLSHRGSSAVLRSILGGMGACDREPVPQSPLATIAARAAELPVRSLLPFASSPQFVPRAMPRTPDRFDLSQPGVLVMPGFRCDIAGDKHKQRLGHPAN